MFCDVSVMVYVFVCDCLWVAVFCCAVLCRVVSCLMFVLECCSFVLVRCVWCVVCLLVVVLLYWCCDAVCCWHLSLVVVRVCVGVDVGGVCVVLVWFRFVTLCVFSVLFCVGLL